MSVYWSRPIVIYDGFADREPKTPAFEGEDLVEFLTSHDTPKCSANDNAATASGITRCAEGQCVAKSSATCWSPAEYIEGRSRGNENVLRIHYATFDLDHCRTSVAEIEAGISEFEYVLHSTHSHAENDPCYRLVFPLSRPVSPTEWPDVYDAIVFALDLPVDRLVDPSRLYAAPTARAGVEPYARHHRGEPLDVEQALQIARENLGLAAAKVAPAERPILTAPPDPIDLGDLRGALAMYRRSAAASSDPVRRQKGEIVGSLLDGRALAGEGARDATLNRACGILSRVLDDKTPWAAVEVLLRPSLSKMATEAEPVDYWISEVQDMFARAQRRRVEKDAQTEASNRRVLDALKANRRERDNTEPDDDVEELDDAAFEIEIGPDEKRVVDQAVRALGRADEPYSRGGQLVEVIVDDPATRGLARSGPIARIARCAEARVSELLAANALWYGASGGEGVRRRVHPPQWVVRAVMARGTWPGVRPIVGVVTAPTLRLDGSILDRQGYDAATGLYLASSIEVRVPDAPTLDDARAAVDVLLDLVSDFPFASPASRSAWLAGLLSQVARPAIDGCVPMFLIDASVRGSGKSLAVDVASIVATGRPAARMLWTEDDGELRKRITASALAGDQSLLIDNVTGQLGSAALDAALTSRTWRDRILGASEMTGELPLAAVWWSTSNNCTVGGDLARRALSVRLEPDVEKPEEREGFRHPRLLSYVAANRAQLLEAALSIVRGFIVAGRPDQKLKPMGSFEAWTDLVRGALVWVGLADPIATVAELNKVDTALDALRGVIEAWPVPDGEPITARELVAKTMPLSDPREPDAWTAALREWVPVRKGDARVDPLALGRALHSVRRRVVGDFAVDSEKKGKAGVPWVRRRVRGT